MSMEDETNPRTPKILTLWYPHHVRVESRCTYESQQMGWRAFRMPLTANAWVKSLVRIPRNPPKIETSLVTPFIRILGLPRPVDPAAPRLPRCQIYGSLAFRADEQRVLTGDLCFPKLAQEDLVIITEGISVPGPWRATSDV